MKPSLRATLGTVDVSLYVAKNARTPAVLTIVKLLRDRLTPRIPELDASAPMDALSRGHTVFGVARPRRGSGALAPVRSRMAAQGAA